MMTFGWNNGLWMGILLSTPVAIYSQEAPKPQEVRQLEPGELFYNSYMAIKDGERFEKSGEFLKSFQAYDQAEKVLAYLSENYPDWKINIVRNRQNSTKQAKTRVQAEAEKMAQNRPSFSDLVENPGRGTGAILPQSNIGSNRPISPVQPNPTAQGKTLREIDLERQLANAQDELRKIKQAGGDVKKLQEDLSQLRGELHRVLNEREIAEKRIKSLEDRLAKQRPNIPEVVPTNPEDKDLAAQLNAARAQINKLSDKNILLEDKLQAMSRDFIEMRASRDAALGQRDDALRKLAVSNPLRQQMEEMNRELTRSKLEVKTMARALKDTRLELEDALSKSHKAEAGEAAFLQRIGELRTQMENERKANDKITNALSKTLAQAEQQLATSKAESQKHKENVQQLERRLKETQLQLGEITTERDNLLAQRDQMAEMLKLNEPGQIKAILDENVALQKQLKEAEAKYDQLAADSKTSREEIDKARTEIALLKNSIISNRDENVAFRKRITELANKLQLTQVQLEKASTSSKVNTAAAEENILLKEIISRQLRILASREKARELVIASYKRLGIQDPQMKDAVQALSIENFSLTDEEKNLVSNAQDKVGVNGVLVAPGYGTPEARAHAQANLEEEMNALGRTAGFAYDKGRYAAAEQLFRTMLEVHPQHFASLVNLGTVQLKLEQPTQAIASFRDALDMNPEHPAAHFMLGVALYRLGQDAEAAKEFKETIKLDPTHSKSLVYLGNIEWSAQNFLAASLHFEKAIGIDPEIREARYNLVNVLLKAGKNDEAKEAYDALIHHGFMPDAVLEKQLKSAGVLDNSSLPKTEETKPEAQEPKDNNESKKESKTNEKETPDSEASSEKSDLKTESKIEKVLPEQKSNQETKEAKGEVKETKEEVAGEEEIPEISEQTPAESQNSEKLPEKNKDETTGN